MKKNPEPRGTCFHPGSLACTVGYPESLTTGLADKVGEISLFLFVQRTNHRTEIVSELIKVKELVSNTGWARIHVPRFEFNARYSIPGIPFLHMYRGLDLVWCNSAGNSAFQMGHTVPSWHLFTRCSHILFHKLYRGLGDIKRLDRAPSLNGITI